MSKTTTKTASEALAEKAAAAAKRMIIPEGRRGYWARRLADNRLVFIEDADGPDMN